MGAPSTTMLTSEYRAAFGLQSCSIIKPVTATSHRRKAVPFVLRSAPARTIQLNHGPIMDLAETRTQDESLINVSL